MKPAFFTYLFDFMEKNDRIWFLTADLGWPRTEEAKERFPERFINCQAAEQTMMDIAVGLALSNKIPVTYTISPFYYRAWETLRTYISHERLNVKMVGCGRGNQYSMHDGFSHDAKDIPEMFRELKNVVKRFPQTDSELKSNMEEMFKEKAAFFLNINK